MAGVVGSNPTRPIQQFFAWNRTRIGGFQIILTIWADIVPGFPSIYDSNQEILTDLPMLSLHESSSHFEGLGGPER